MEEGRMCKICNKVFSNGRALGGHMRSHLVTLPLPLKKKPIQLQFSTESTTSVTISSDEEEREIDDQEKLLMYGLRENPKRSFRMADPEFLDHGGSDFVVQEDRESETEVNRKKTNPTRKRSKRPRVTRLVKESDTSSELEPVMSSVSDQISPEEDVALCLMMLSRDVQWSFVNSNESTRGRNRSKYQCETCEKVFDSFQALGGHKTSHRKIENEFAGGGGGGGVGNKFFKKNVVVQVQDDVKLHECPFCYRVFGSGQALGGHKRSHVSGSSTTTVTASDYLGGSKVDGSSVHLVNSTKREGNLVIIDLNLPAPTEDEENSSSAVSDAEFYQSPLYL